MKSVYVRSVVASAEAQSQSAAKAGAGASLASCMNRLTTISEQYSEPYNSKDLGGWHRRRVLEMLVLLEIEVMVWVLR